jgi:hypothetical protein
MRVNRAFLYAGVFLVAIGGLAVLSDADVIDPAALVDVLRLWPLAVIALGLGLALKRTRFGLQGGLVAALVPGLVIGSGFAVLPRFAGDCGTRTEPTASTTQRGTFAAPATITLRSGCGTLDVHTAPGSGWQLDAGNTDGRSPAIDASDDALSIDSAAGHGWEALGGGRDRWNVVIPAGAMERFALVANASRSHVDLAGAHVGSVAITGNAAQVVLDATSASIGELSAVINTGLLSVHLPAASDTAGSIRLGGGELQVCSPPGVGLLVTASRGVARQIVVEGVDHDGSTFQSAGYESAVIHADLDVRVNFGTIEINPTGGCR